MDSNPSQKQGEDARSNQEGLQTTRQQQQQAVSNEATALANADALNSSLLRNDMERSYVTLKEKHDRLKQESSGQVSQISSLQEKVDKLQKQLNEKDDSLAKAVHMTEMEKRKSNSLEAEERSASERMTRMEVEADSLFQQIRSVTTKSYSHICQNKVSFPQIKINCFAPTCQNLIRKQL